MDILYRRGRATVGEVMAELSGDPAYSTVRAQLRVLEEKGQIRHEEQGLRYTYLPAASRHTVRQSALKHLIETFSMDRLRKSWPPCSARTARKFPMTSWNASLA